MNLIKFLEYIKLRGDIEFLGAVCLEFTREKIKVNFLYKKMLKVIAELDFNTDFVGEFCVTDIKELIKTLKSIKKDFKIKLDKEVLICYNEKEEVKINGVKKEFIIFKPTKIKEVEYFDFSKEQIKTILDFRKCMNCKELRVISAKNEMTLSADDGEVSREEKISLTNINNFDIILSNDFLDILSLINNECNLRFENDRVYIKFCGENFKINYCLKGLKNE